MLFSFEEHHALLLDVFSSGTVYFFEMSLLSGLFLSVGYFGAWITTNYCLCVVVSFTKLPSTGRLPIDKHATFVAILKCVKT
jgi:hypothetical protein